MQRGIFLYTADIPEQAEQDDYRARFLLSGELTASLRKPSVDNINTLQEPGE